MRASAHHTEAGSTRAACGLRPPTPVLCAAPLRTMGVGDIMEDLLNDSEEEEAVVRACLAAVEGACMDLAATPEGWRGRVSGSAPNVRRGASEWLPLYLGPSPTYTAAHFRQRFRVPLAMFRLLETELPAVEPSLRQASDCTGRAGHLTSTKLMNSLRRLGNGGSYQDLDDQARMSIESQRSAFYSFLRAVRTRFRPRFLNREPSLSELHDVEEGYAARGFPGCVGCVDCMKAKWKNCPRALKGQYKNPKDSKLAVISCEALVDGSLYCWHFFAGRPGTNNDVTVLDHSPLFTHILAGKRRMYMPEGYTVNGVARQLWYKCTPAPSVRPRRGLGGRCGGRGKVRREEVRARDAGERLRP